MIKSIYENDRKVYFDNFVDEEDILTIRRLLKKLGKLEISFNVVGRTKHQMLGNELIRRVNEKTKVVGHTDYQSYGVEIELEKKFKAVYQFTDNQGIKYYKDQFCNWYGVQDGEINFCCNWKNGTPPDEKLEFDRQVFDVELLEADDK